MGSWLLRWTIWVGILGFSISAMAEPCGQDFACHEVLVKFSRHLSNEDIEGTLQIQNLQVIDYFPKTRLYLLGIPHEESTEQKIEALASQPNFLRVIPNYRMQVEDTIPNDPYFNQLWGLQNTGQWGGTPGSDIGMVDVWGDINDCEEKVIAVIDTGVDYTHPDLSENIWSNSGEIPNNGIDDDRNGYIDDIHGYDFYNNDNDPMDDNGHGTHVAGTIGALGNNGIGITGVCWKSRIMVLKFLGSGGSGFLSDAIRAVEYSIDMGAKVLNNSWGSSFSDAQLDNLLLASDQAGQVFVAAAGNDGTNNDVFPFFPASYTTPNVLSVASTDRYDQLSYFSNYGQASVDLGAPGSEILSAVPGSSYSYKSGTSMAAPHVTGATALLWSAHPELSHRQIKNYLLKGVSPNNELTDKTLSGGILNVSRSQYLMENSANLIPTATAGADQYRKVGETITLQGSGTNFESGGLNFSWSLQVPSGSKASLSNPNTSNPSFIPDKEGNYYAILTVENDFGSSAPDVVAVIVNGDILSPPSIILQANTEDQANVNAGNVISIGEKITFDASKTDAFFPENLLFEWYWLDRPTGSEAELSTTDQAETSFTPDRPGTYTVGLTVEDGFHESTAELSIVAVEEEVPEGTIPQAGGCALIK